MNCDDYTACLNRLFRRPPGRPWKVGKIVVRGKTNYVYDCSGRLRAIYGPRFKKTLKDFL